MASRNSTEYQVGFTHNANIIGSDNTSKNISDTQYLQVPSDTQQCQVC